jgi:hypothetical protein
MGTLKIAGIVLVVLTGTLAVFLYIRGAQSSRRALSGQKPHDQGEVSRDDPMFEWWGNAIKPTIERRMRARQDTWNIVARVCTGKHDPDRLHGRFNEMSKAAAQEEFSSRFSLRITYLAAVSFAQLSTYAYAAREVRVRVPATHDVTSGWWAILPLVASSIVAMLVIHFTRYSPKRIIFTLSFIGATLCVAGISGRGPRFYLHLGWLSLFTGGTLILLAANASIVALASAQIRRKLWTYRATDVHAFADVQMALRHLGDNVEALSDLSICSRVARLLDSAAACVENGLLRALSLQYGPSSMVVKSRLEGAARRLRSYQTWVALPNAGTRGELQRELSEFLAVLCCREYDSLPWSPPPDGALPRGLSKALSTVRTLVTAVAPLALIKGAEQVGAVEGGPILQGILLLSVIWMLAGIFTAADPLLGPHLSAVKDLMGAFRSMGGDK